MSIITDSIVNIGVNNVFNIGLSKSISQYSADEIFEFPYCSSSWDMFRHINDVSYNDICPSRLTESQYEFPFKFSGVNQNYTPATYSFTHGEIEYNQGDKGIYGRIIWLWIDDNQISSEFGLRRCVTQHDNVKIITQMDVTKIMLFANNYIQPVEGNTNVNYIDFDNIKIIETVNDETQYVHPSNCSIFPAVMFKHNNKLYIHRLSQNSYTSLDWSWWLSYYGDESHGGHTETQGHHFDAQPVSFDETSTAYLPINIMRDFVGLRPQPVERHYTSSDIPDVGVVYEWEYAYTGGRITASSLEKYLANISWYGCFFRHNNVDYKPIIQNGYVVGYTDDMTVQSDIDSWTGATNHDVPLEPTATVTDHESNMPLAYISGNAGMVTFYEINKSGLASADDISDAISRFDISQIGKDVLRNLISFKAFAAISVNDTVDRQIKIAGIPLEDSCGNELTGRVIGGVKPIDLFPVSGGVTIPTLYNDYRDYEPYTKIQMYVPFCGWFNLPPWCIGKKITGTMFTDLYNGTVKAVIYASQTVVAEVGGCCAYDIPFVADATGAKASAVISSALTTAAAVGATVAMPNVATGIAAVSSAANLAATLNSNDTTLKGVLGDGSNLNGLLHVYIKVSRPNSPNGVTTIPDSYKHEIGIPTMKEIKISAGDGYIQVMDAKVTGTMTAREKQIIIDGFRHGLNF